MNGRDAAERERTIRLLTEKMLTPPFDPENPPPPKPTSHERFTVVADELLEETQGQALQRNEVAKKLWEQ